MKFASFGSVSTATLQTDDLLKAFANTLEQLVQDNAEEWCSDAGRTKRDKFLALVNEAREIDPESEEADYLLNEELFDALEFFAPPYAYFGSHPGDGADFGFWLTEDIGECFDGIKVGDTSEVPANYEGEVLHVNDHGNMTLYVADKGKLTEVWGLV